MSCLNSLIKFALNTQWPKIQRYMQNPALVQDELFQNLIKTAQTTAFGQQHNFAKIKTRADYQQAVPISSYEQLYPYIERMIQGEANVLWPGKIDWFSKSSGTTNAKSKYIPVSQVNLHSSHLKSSHDIVKMWYKDQPQTRVFTEFSKSIAMGGSHSWINQSAGIRAGDVSAIIMEEMPFYAQYFLTCSKATCLLPNWEEKIDQIARDSIGKRVTNLCGVPTWTIVLFQRMLELTGKENMLEVLPNFELYMHGGVNFTPYRSQFEVFFPGKQVKYRNVYNSSEGFFAGQMAEGDEDMLLFLENGTFYEFIPMEELHKENPQVHTVSTVELGVNYALVISTNAGLWRYLIGDTVCFTSLKPHKIQLTGRTQHFINAFGEELMVDNADKALGLVAQKHSAIIADYTVAPIYLSTENKGKHQWLIAFEQPPTNIDLFARDLDQTLQHINSDYEAKRYKNMALENLEIKVLPPKTFYNWLKQENRLGGQSKIPRLSNNRKYVEQILKFIQI